MPLARGSTMAVEYKTDDVLTAARKRVALVFEEFDRVVVSVSSGKDSTVLRHLAIDEASRRERKIELFFLDQEAEYQSTVDLMAGWMRDPRVDPRWFQVPLSMTNATSHSDYWLNAWGEGEKWMRDKDPVAIQSLPPGYPRRFYDFFEWYEKQTTVKTAFLVGLRSRESFNRFRAVTKRAGYAEWGWSTKTKNRLAFRVYPLFDWTFGDVWKYIVDNGIEYNRHYDRMFAKHGVNMSRMRVSNLIHEQAFRCLADLQEFEPETYDRLIRRIGGVHCAALYAREKHVYDARSLPAQFSSWREYRDYLLDSTPCDKISRFRKRFSGQPDDVETCRRQCKQILTNDWENNVGVANTNKDKLRKLWWDRL
jgi:predicted phosphoadenosine phosphosulfate sulfurtransferase